MSLSVDVFIRTPDGGVEVLDVPEGASDLAGFESWRHSVWGLDRVRGLGAEFFPVLARDDLYVEPNEVERFQHECALVRSNLDALTGAVDPLNPRSTQLRVVDGRYQLHAPDDAHAAFAATVSTRLANIEDAVRRALVIGAGVVIW